MKSIKKLVDWVLFGAKPETFECVVLDQEESPDGEGWWTDGDGFWYRDPEWRGLCALLQSKSSAQN